MNLCDRNSEILFLYDAKMTNPNGDPDDENKPRMDYEKEVNLVSDVRLKRYIRDYLESKGYEIFVAKVDGQVVDATERLKRFLGKDNKLEKLSAEDMEKILQNLIDVRLFGATMPIKAQKKEGKEPAPRLLGQCSLTGGTRSIEWKWSARAPSVPPLPDGVGREKESTAPLARTGGSTTRSLPSTGS